MIVDKYLEGSQANFVLVQVNFLRRGYPSLHVSQVGLELAAA